MWDSEIYKTPFSIPLSGGGSIHCATKRDTDPAEVYVVTSKDNVTPDAAPALAATIEGTRTACHLRLTAEGRVELTNGFDVLRYSDALGAEDSWLDLT